MTRTAPLSRRPNPAIPRILGAMVMTLGLLLAIMAGARPANAQAGGRIACTAHDDVVEQLGRRFAEERVALGVASNGGLIEVYSTPSGSTWTIVVTTPRGLSCPVTAGEDWYSIAPRPDGPEA